MIQRIVILFFASMLAAAASGQKIQVYGRVRDLVTGKGVSNARVHVEKSPTYVCDSSGYFTAHLSPGKHAVIVEAPLYDGKVFEWNVTPTSTEQTFDLIPIIRMLDTVTVIGGQHPWDVQSQIETSGTTIYAGKKNELIDLNTLSANTAINNSRQLYAKVPGINIIENDQAGVQLGIATRGLNPNRTTEFNSRQNGYDISADPIGYPENYYSPPADALSAIEIIRGAASLQYGTQFGGLLNFKFRKGPSEKAFNVVSKQTVGSYGFFNSFNSVGGQGNKLNYYGFYNYKRSDGWRQNTGFDIHNTYISLKYALTKKLMLGFDYTFMYYQMKQPGGLTDRQFREDPKQSLRNRNWFSANWNVPALTLDYAINSNQLLSVKAYSLLATRKNVGNLNPVNYADGLSTPRIVMNDAYQNFYMEVRYIRHYKLIGNAPSSFLTGMRLYHGDTHRIQGYNFTGADASFTVRNSEALQIDYRFPSYNAAYFAENIFQLTRNFSVTPGIRLEYIQTNARGYTIADTTTNIKTNGNQTHTRRFPLIGTGLDYKVSSKTDAYANFSQNYSPISFGDIVILQPGMQVDPNLKDVKGYNFDLGYRGRAGKLFNFDVSGFYMLYKNRVGSLLQTDGGGNVYQYKTNISDSRSLGAETYGEINFLRLFSKYPYKEDKLSFYSSVAFTHARYINAPSDRRQFEGKRVEYAPQWIDRFGMMFLFNKMGGSLQYSYTDPQFSDATNARSSNDGIVGIIPAYHVIDLTIDYSINRWKLSMSINNLANEMYFTRRASGFPGPGIIPSQGRSLYASVQFKL